MFRKITNKQQTVSNGKDVRVQRTTIKKRTCLGVLSDGTHCTETIPKSLDGGNRICPACTARNNAKAGNLIGLRFYRNVGKQGEE